MEKFAKRLRKLRIERDKTLSDMEKELGITQATLSRYENDTREPKVTILNKLADYFNVSLDYLIGKTDHKHGYRMEENELTQELQNLLKKYDVEYIEVIDKAKEKGLSPKDVKGIIDTFEEIEELLKNIKKNKK